jgi:hypothetical protein
MTDKPVNPFDSSSTAPTITLDPSTTASTITVPNTTALTITAASTTVPTITAPTTAPICPTCNKPKHKIDKILNNIRHNCVNLSIYHNKRYHLYKNILFSGFRVPLILLSGGNSFIAVGMQNYLSQHSISLLNALISILCGIITSIELLLNLQKRMESELDSYKNYYKLSIEIFRFIKLDESEREESGITFLPKIYEMYETLVITSNAVNVYRRGFVDEFEDINDDAVITELPKTCHTFFCHCCY